MEEINEIEELSSENVYGFNQDVNTEEREVATFRQEVPLEVIQNKKLRKSFGIKIPPRQLLPKVGRNEECPCGSGKKFKKCCIEIYDREYLLKHNSH